MHAACACFGAWAETFPVGAPPADMVKVVRMAVASSEPVKRRSPLVSRQVMGPEWKVPMPLGSDIDTRQVLSLGFQTLAEPSAEAVMTVLPSCENMPQVTDSLCPLSTAMHDPDTAFHIHTEASELPASSTSPLECQLMKVISSPGPSSVATSAPSAEFHTLTTPSIPAVARSEPEVLNATCTTVSVCPLRVAMRCFFARLQSAPVSSPLAVAIKSALDGCTAIE